MSKKTLDIMLCVLYTNGYIVQWTEIYNDKSLYIHFIFISN